MNAPTPNWRNRTLFHGDNLPVLRGMDSETVDLVATDPPFNKSRDFHATPDSLAAGARFEDRWSWERDVHQEWLDQIQDDWPAVWSVIQAARAASGDDMAAFLCWLGVRVMEVHRVLKPTGSLYLHIDHTAHAWVKAMLDGIFGRKQFRNEIVWSYRRWPAKSRNFQRMHDTLLWYSKGEQWVWNQMYEPLAPSTLKADGGKKILNVFDEKGKRVRGTKTGEQSPGALMRAVWDIGFISPTAKERTGYPTQKPLALYERIIEASSNEGDMVLDPFAGCATTCVASERLGRQWAGIDIWKGAYDQVVRRLEDNRQLLREPDPKVWLETAPPKRTDAGGTAAPTLVLKLQIPAPPGPKMTNAEMKKTLLQRDGLRCEGCLRPFDDERYLELDHKTPRSDGGLNHISNRTLLCGPCNRAKSNTLTLSGLRKLNRQNGWMAKA